MAIKILRMKKIDNFKSGLVFNLNFIIIASIYYNVILKLENNIFLYLFLNYNISINNNTF